MFKRSIAVILFLFMMFPVAVCAKDDDYSIYIQDDMDLLSDREENMLRDDMAPVSEYGNVMFASCSSSDAESAARTIYRDHFSHDSGVIFLIDMGCREIYIFSDGEMYKTLNKKYALSITDNVYRKATAGKYYECASEAYSQMYKVLSNKNIPMPMRYINNLFLALSVAILLMYILAILPRYRLAGDAGKKKEDFSMRNEGLVFFNINKILYAHTYNPKTRGSGSFSSGGGGHSSGGGGGHGF